MNAAFPAGRFAKALAWATVLYLLLPISIVLPVSVTDQRFLALPVNGISLTHFATLFGSPLWLGAMLQSFLIATASTALAVLAGAMCAIGCWRISRRATDALRALMLLPLVIPSIVYAVGLYSWYARLHLLDSFLGVILAHAVTALPYVVITVAAALAALDPRQERLWVIQREPDGAAAAAGAAAAPTGRVGREGRARRSQTARALPPAAALGAARLSSGGAARVPPASV